MQVVRYMPSMDNTSKCNTDKCQIMHINETIIRSYLMTKKDTLSNRFKS